jgi:hypothetical protein
MKKTDIFFKYKWSWGCGSVLERLLSIGSLSLNLKELKISLFSPLLSLSEIGSCFVDQAGLELTMYPS